MILEILLSAAILSSSPAAVPVSTSDPIVATAEGPACDASTPGDLEAALRFEDDEYTSNYSVLRGEVCEAACTSERTWCYLDPYFGTYGVCESQFSVCRFNCSNPWTN